MSAPRLPFVLSKGCHVTAHEYADGNKHNVELVLDEDVPVSFIEEHELGVVLQDEVAANVNFTVSRAMYQAHARFTSPLG